MMDGLALGETTPGPLIMVVAFVGFVGAWSKEIFGPEALLMAGFAGASVATLFTFLPSFLFIFLGGPGVEATRGDLKFSAPLSAVTAAVVGVIINLAVFFAQNVLWPNGSDLDLIATLIGVAAFVALFRFKIGIMSVITACAAIGLGLSVLA
jgi:chromate transporter